MVDSPIHSYLPALTAALRARLSPPGEEERLRECCTRSLLPPRVPKQPDDDTKPIPLPLRQGFNFKPEPQKGPVSHFPILVLWLSNSIPLREEFRMRAALNRIHCYRAPGPITSVVAAVCDRRIFM